VIRWRLLETGARPGGWNMACDAALLAHADAGDFAPTLRFYAWRPPAVSLGYHQPHPTPGEAAALLARGVEWVRRPTGGRAVYHGPREEELTYSVVAPLGDSVHPGGLSDCYRRIHEAIAAGLAGLGAAVQLVPRRSAAGGAGNHADTIQPTSRLACFAASVPWEIAVAGRKLVGSAQRRTRRAFLQHGSIPLAGDQKLLADIWPGSLEPDRMTTVSSAVGRRVGFEELAAALGAAFEESLSAKLEPGGLTREELSGIAALCLQRALA
jgi:lipoate-protein ligase A